MAQGKIRGRGGKVGSRGSLLGVHTNIAATDFPLLPWEAPAAATSPWHIGVVGAKALRRRGIKRTRIVLDGEIGDPATVTTTSSIGSSRGAFRTAISASRKRQLLAFPAASFQVAAPSFPVAALGAPAVRRRRDTTNRRALEVGDITSALVAPLIATLPRPKANVVWFERRIQLPLPLAIYPPPVGPPQPVFDAPTAHRRVSQRRRLFVSEQADFAAASGPPSDARVSGEPFRTVSSRSRKRQPVPPAPFFTAATPPATVTLPAPTVKRRHDGERRLQQSLLAEFAATPPSTSPVTIAALAARKTAKRRQRHGLLLSGGAGIFDSPSVPYAVTPAALHQQGWFKRRDTERRLQTVTPLATYDAAAYTPSDALVTGEAFRTRLGRSRRLIRQPTAASFEAAPPVTAPVVALPTPKANRRRPRRGVLLTGGDGVFQPPRIVLPAPKAFRVEHRRKLVRLQPLATYTVATPMTFPVTALPAPLMRKVHGLGRRLLVAPVWLIVETYAPPVVTLDEGGCGGVDPEEYDWEYRLALKIIARERGRRQRLVLEIPDDEVIAASGVTPEAIQIDPLLPAAVQPVASRASVERISALVRAQNRDSKPIAVTAIEGYIRQYVEAERKRREQDEEDFLILAAHALTFYD